MYEFAVSFAAFLSCAAAGSSIMLSIIWGIHAATGTPRSPILERWTDSMVLSTLGGGVVWLSICMLYSLFDRRPHFEAIMLIAAGFGIFFFWLLLREQPRPKPLSTDEDVQSSSAAVSCPVPTMCDTQRRTPAITTAVEAAADIRNPVSAWTNRVATNAQIQALDDAARLAAATTKAASAEVAGIDAILRRDEKFAEFEARQRFRDQLLRDKVIEQEQAVLEAAHQRELAVKRRQKELLEAERAGLSAKHGVEAEKKFKKHKFDLGEERARARVADVEVDRATAKAAVDQLGGLPAERRASRAPRTSEIIDDLRRRTVEEEAAGRSTLGLRAALDALLKSVQT